MSEYSYTKKEKLKKQKQIDALFQKRKSVNAYPIKAFFTFPEEKMDFCLKAGVGTSKRNFKRAVHRNRVKRLLREAWRLNKQELITLLEKNEQQMMVFLHYSDKILPSFELAEEKVKLLIQKLIQVANEKHTQSH